jgi:hypothetical protein
MTNQTKLTLTDIEQWIDNDESLYNWWKGSRQGRTRFIKENRSELEEAIQSRLAPKVSKYDYWRL